MSASMFVLCLLANVGAGPGEATGSLAAGSAGAVMLSVPNPCAHPGIFNALEVVRAYRDNQAYAAKFIEGREVQVSGRMIKLAKVSEDLLPTPETPKVAFQILLTPDGKPPVKVALTFIFEDDEEDLCKLAQLFPGQYIRIKATYYEVVEADGRVEVKFRHARLAF
jgi:hypothetical protein